MHIIPTISHINVPIDLRILFGQRMKQGEATYILFRYLCIINEIFGCIRAVLQSAVPHRKSVYLHPTITS